VVFLCLLLSLAAVDGARARLRGVDAWGYVLQGPAGGPLNYDALLRSPARMLVVDPSELDGGRVARLRSGGRVVLGYLSVGEAERYRGYWRAAWTKAPPSFIGPENPDWPGNLKVRYWDGAWEALVARELDALVAAGFDGAWLDVVDAFEFWHPERRGAPAEMARLVRRLATRARRQAPGFLVVPQNGATILSHLSAEDAAAYLAAVDAIGAEDTFFFGAATHDNPWRPQRTVLAALRRFRDAGRPVFAVDYLTRPEQARRFVGAARAEGFVPYVGRRALDRLVVQP